MNIYGDKITLVGSSSAGCYYTFFGCNISNPATINNTFWTGIFIIKIANTNFNTYYATNHLYGLSYFIVGYDRTPSYSLGFNISNIINSGGTYQTSFSYTGKFKLTLGNADGKFGVAYSYLIIL